MGGEKPDIYRQLSLLGGSPPHGRGKACRHAQLDNQGRITPAWAGKRLAPAPTGFKSQDHPRVGGEKHGSDSWSGVCQGSPPRGRGKGGLLVCGQGRHGITPAWAGKRVCSGLCYVLGWDHPRVGGEKGRAVLGPVLGTGSPPRGRGKDLAKSARWKGAGITPAWAGKRLQEDDAYR